MHVKSKFTIKDEILIKIGKQIDNQIDKGVAKYGQTLDECPTDSYDWQQMINEELIDALQYANKDIRKLRKKVKRLETHILYLTGGEPE